MSGRELIGRSGGGREEPQIPLSADGIDDGVRAGTHFSKKRAAVWRVVETVADSAEDLLWLIGGGDFHVENNARFFRVNRGTGIGCASRVISGEMSGHFR